jgi:hypothetical protein
MTDMVVKSDDGIPPSARISGLDSKRSVKTPFV